MLFQPQTIPYHRTHFFAPLVLDYLDGGKTVQPFYAQPPTIEGLQSAIAARKKHPVNRALLVTELQKQYSAVVAIEAVQKNIELLQNENTFTICTAHQPNLFTGPLYFMYKILHAIKLAQVLKQELPAYHFVPVYYMGSEDADFAELNHTYVRGKKLEWHKVQTGAVGRMVVDKTLVELINELQGQLYFEDHAAEVTDLLKQSYTEGKTIQEATFQLINQLYGPYGLVVLIPDNAALKRQMLPVFKEDIFNQVSAGIVGKTSEALEKNYKVQAHPREVNLFYLKDQIRERIVQEGDHFRVHNTAIQFSREAIKKELNEHPERFSPNVILRGLYQETILPNLAFIGGGGELSYWLQLKELFQHYGVPYPVLVLRNSFMILEKEVQELMDKTGLDTESIFLPAIDILNRLIERSGKMPALNGELKKAEELYASLQELALGIDASLGQHIEALKTRTLNQLTSLEKKLMRAERKKHEVLGNQINKIKTTVFPAGGLQERVENFSSFHARWGRAFIDEVLKHSLALEQQFMILKG